MTFDLRARPLLLVLLLSVAAAAAGLMVLSHNRSSNDQGTESAVAAPKAPSAHAPRKAPGARHATQARRKAAATAPFDRLPAAVRRALAEQRVVVIALYDPKAKIDGTAVGEARAGAQLTGSSFVPLDVRKNGVASINARFGAIQDPAVLVLRPPGSLVVRIDGFADRDTVAQAAANAAS